MTRTAVDRPAAPGSVGSFEKRLPLRVALAIAAGVALGNLVPGRVAALAAEVAEACLAPIILLGAAPCTAMVLVWSELTRGDPNDSPLQVGANDVVMIVALAPVVALLPGVTDIAVRWETLPLSVGLTVTVMLLFGVRGATILARPRVTTLIAVPVMPSLVALANPSRLRFPA